MPSIASNLLRFRALAAVLAGVTGLTGCASAGLSRDLTGGNQAIAEARTQEIVLNVLRARDGLPPIFTVVDTLRRDSERGAGASLRIPFGQDAANLFPLDITGRGERRDRSYQESLQTQDFYLGVSQPITPEQFEAIVRAGAPKAAVLHLMLDRVVVAPLDARKPLRVNRGYLGTFANDPTDPGRQRAFLVWLALLTNEPEGFTTCREVEVRIVSPDDVFRKRDLDDLADVTEAYRAGLELRTNRRGFVEVVRRTPEVEFCIEATGLDAEPGFITPRTGPLPRSLRLRNRAASGSQTGAIVLTDEAANLRVTYQVRSVLGVFDYLGRLTVAREATPGFREPYADAQGRSLFDLRRGADPRSPVQVRYGGQPYSLVGRDRSNSPVVVSAMVQLLGLNQSLRRRSAARIEVDEVD